MIGSAPADAHQGDIGFIVGAPHASGRNRGYRAQEESSGSWIGHADTPYRRSLYPHCGGYRHVRVSYRIAIERETAPPWLPDASGSGEYGIRLFQPPDAENRTSSGVGGRWGAI